ncbi:hypothetical protein GC209_14350 [bacterium]|nr:hypothetical protein [bacterium]
MELLTRKFTAQSVALATGATAKEIANWADRGLIVGQREPLGKGFKRAFSWFNVMEIGGAAALMRIGINSPADAFAASQWFSHGSDGATGYMVQDDDAIREDQDAERLPGLPYHYLDGTTYLCVSGGKAQVALSRDGTLDLKEINRGLNVPLGFIALNVSRLFNGILQRMALSSVEVLDEAYGK